MAWPTRGQRFNLDLDDDEVIDRAVSTDNLHFISDIQERSSNAPTAPSAPSFKNQTTGFPAHKKRVSKFAKAHSKDASSKSVSFAEDETSRHGSQSGDSSQANGKPMSFEEQERQKIDVENRQRLAAMSDAEIEEARAELLSSLNPSMLEKLLRMGNIDDDPHGRDFPSPEATPPDSDRGRLPKTSKKVPFQDDGDISTKERPLLSQPPFAEKGQDVNDATQIRGFQTNVTASESPASSDAKAVENPLDSPSIHFPHPSEPPDLDPNSSSFLTDLHTKYFPTLSHDPSKLAWMTDTTIPPSIDPNSDPENPSQRIPTTYSPHAAALAPTELRFSFSGALIPPKIAHEIPVNLGLHHHGDAPEAAGYTIGELAILSRSTVAAQRCIGYSVLGKILFRLGKGEFGDTMEEDVEEGEGYGGNNGDDNDVVEEDRLRRGMGEMARGMWQVMHSEHIIDILTTAASEEGEKRHASARAYAQEAVWLWRRGGGRRWKAE
ncbi:MAG: hypothetical protein M1820_002663 [Bogoriella megaspora]|nr:MAG: hypothetical protein M1820_002663 [Bogoriella megaspora]